MAITSSPSINCVQDELEGEVQRKESAEPLTGNQHLLESGEKIASVSNFRCTVPQVLATMVQSLLLLALGMMIACPTVVIAALLKSETELHITSSQASWFAGLLLICQPIGSIVSGLLQEVLGRKKCMLSVNIPQLVGWYLIHRAQAVYELFIAATLMGISVGFMEAPTLSYVGEISQPHLRGTLASFTSIYVSFGYFTMYLLGTVVSWRTATLISCSVPVISFIAISLIPESPIWLLYNGRKAEAEKALCWLRGWVTPDVIRTEFTSMIKYCEEAKQKTPIVKVKTCNDYTLVTNGHVTQPSESKLVNFLKDLVRPEMMRPLKLVVTYFLFLHCASMSGIRPYMVIIFGRLNMPIDSHVLTIMSAAFQITGSLCCMMVLHRIGKRKLSLISMSACSLICLLLGVYTVLFKLDYLVKPWIPLVLFCCLFFCTNLGINVVPWTLLAEVFPSRGRGIGGGLSAATYYLEFFLVSKTFLDLESLLHLYGVFFFYGSCGLLGVIYIYRSLPETEGKSLEDVENYFKTKRDNTTIES